MAVSDAQILGRTVDAILDNRVKLTTADNAPVSGGNPVPAGKTAYFVKGYVAMMNTDKNGTDATFKWYMRGNNGGPYCWQTKGEVGLVNIGNSYWIYEYGIPAGPIPAKTDVRIAMTQASETHSVEGGFDLLLVDN